MNLWREKRISEPYHPDARNHLFFPLNFLLLYNAKTFIRTHLIDLFYPRSSVIISLLSILPALLNTFYSFLRCAIAFCFLFVSPFIFHHVYIYPVYES